MVKLKKQIVSDNVVSKRSYGYGNPIKYITIHQTGNTNKGANAQAHANIQSNLNPRQASWHYQVDDKQAIQSFDDKVKCWHASDGKGAGNTQSIAIEICINSDGDYKQAVKNAAELTKQLMNKYDLKIENVKQHHDWYPKNCPAQLRAGYKGIKWTDFLKMINDKSNDEVYTVQKGDTLWGIAKKYDTTVDAIADYNNIKDASVIHPGQKLRLTKPQTGILKRGDRGTEVKKMQQALASIYFYPDKGAPNNGIDGIYGPKTEDAVRRFQSVYLPHEVDGVYGPNTREALEKVRNK